MPNNRTDLCKAALIKCKIHSFGSDFNIDGCLQCNDLYWLATDSNMICELADVNLNC